MNFNTNYIEYYEYKSLVNSAIEKFIAKLNLQFVEEKEFGVELTNKVIHLDISFRYREFNLTISNGVNKIDLNDLIFKKYPNYIELVKSQPERSIFLQSVDLRWDIRQDFIYCTRRSFEFIEENFNQIFRGIF